MVHNRKVEEILQVCWNVEKPATKEREVRALVTAGEELKCKKLLILTENKEGRETIEWFGRKASVQFLPLWKWMME